MKICMIVPFFPPHIGGGEQLYYDIAKGILHSGHEIRVVTSSTGESRGRQLFDGIEVYYCDWKQYFGHPLVRRQDIAPHVAWADVVHTAVFTPAPVSRRAARAAHKPCILTVHEVIGEKWFWFESNPLKALAFRAFEHFVCAQRFDAYHVVSEATKRDYIRYIGNRAGLTRIYNSVHLPDRDAAAREAISLRAYFGLCEGEKSFLYFGRPSPNKGVFVLEDAIAALHRCGAIPANVKFCFLLAPEPAPQRQRFLARMEREGLSEHIVVRGSVRRNELFKLISDADYVIIPSVTEGFGFSAAEACSLGKEVVCSDGGSLPEVVSGQVLFFENRSAEDLADKLSQVIAQGSGAFRSIPAKDFSVERMNAGILALYQKVLCESR